jgi:hypothetical protein
MSADRRDPDEAVPSLWDGPDTRLFLTFWLSGVRGEIDPRTAGTYRSVLQGYEEALVEDLPAERRPSWWHDPDT